jgi:hypothetical protein
MNVRLAAQVLSNSVAKCLSTLRQIESNSGMSVYSDTSGTETFCTMFNRLFDCFNTRHLLEATQKANDDLRPYTYADDIRLKWLEDGFLKYLDDWEAYAQSKQNVPLAEREKMTLSKQTKEGLKITVLSFIEVVPYLLSLDGANFLYSERFNQDTLESFFGKQRARCGRNDNPTVYQFTKNTQTIRVGRSMAFGSCSNIKRRLFTDGDVKDLSQPLRKKNKTQK